MVLQSAEVKIPSYFSPFHRFLFNYKRFQLMFFIQVYSVLPGGDGGCDGRLPDLPWEGGRKNMVGDFCEMVIMG